MEKLSPHNKEYMKCRKTLRMCGKILRNMSILDFIIHREPIKDIAAAFDLSRNRVYQIARLELLRYNHMVRSENPLTMKSTQLERRRKVIDSWANWNDDKLMLWKVFPSSYQGKMLKEYIKFNKMRAEFWEHELISNKYYRYVKYVEKI